MIFTIASYNFRRLIASPKVWCFYAVQFCILAWLNDYLINDYSLIEKGNMLANNFIQNPMKQILHPYYGWLIVTSLFVVPLISMPLIASERENRTIELLYSAPVSVTAIVLGNFIALLGILTIGNLFLLLIPFTIYFTMHVDAGIMLAQIIGIIFVTSSFAAIGLCCSSLTRSSHLAGFFGIGVLALLSLSAWIQPANFASEGSMQQISLLYRFQPFMSGVIRIEDIIFYLSIVGCSLALCISRLSWEKGR